MSTPHLLRFAKGVLAATVCGLSVISCADLARTGSGPAYLIMERVEAASGGGSGVSTFTASLESDVLVGGQAFRDVGQASIRVEMKNSRSTTAPTAISAITINRYRVRYRRTDGQNRRRSSIRSRRSTSVSMWIAPTAWSARRSSAAATARIWATFSTTAPSRPASATALIRRR